MYAKRIVLRNFKSFAKATLELDRSFSSIVGPNGSGKCVRGDTKVLLSDGSLVEIRRLVDEALARESSAMDDGYCSFSNNGVSVPTLNPKTLKMEERPVTAFIKRASPAELYELKTASGRKVVATSYHPVLTVVDGEVKAVNADQLKEGSWVALPRKLSTRPSNVSPLLELARLDLSLYVVPGADFVVLLRNCKQSKKATWREFALKAGVPLACLKGLLDGQAIKLNHAYKLAKFLGDSDYEFASVFNQVKAKNHGILTRVPMEVSPDLARFLGLVISEGRPVKNEVFFFNSSKALLDDFAGLSERLFGIRPSLKSYGISQVVILSSKAISLMLEHVFGIKPYTHSSRKTVPGAIMSSPDCVVAAFVGGLFDGDGTVSNPAGSQATLEYASASRELVDCLNYLLLRFGITSRVSSSVKAATNTANRTKREYHRLFVHGVSLLGVFARNIRLSEPLRSQRLSVWSEKATVPNPNVDVVPGLNARIRGLLSAAGFSDRKLKGVAPSKIRAYYENRCLPTRDGLTQVTRLVQDPSLEAFAFSDVFWDRITGIGRVPGEEWVYDLTVEGNHNFVAEGMFVHNSNTVDALMFAFGEMRLKSLRVKSTKDLIFKSANVAEVSVLLVEDGVTDFAVQEVEEKGKTKRLFPKGVHEVRRLIRKDGKTKYVLDGRSVKKYVIDDFLINHNISLHNVIKQGEVQRIVEMNPKDRRTLIDFVANVSEYEDKKREALLEMGKVDARLKEALTVFAEREGYLRELEQEKRNAEKYLQLEQQLRQLSATLLHIDLRIMEAEFESLVSANIDYRNKVDALHAAIKEHEAAIDAAYQQKDALNRTISEKSQGRSLELERAIAALTAETDSAKALIEDKKSLLKRMDEKRRNISLDHQRAGDEVKGFERQLKQLTEDVESVRKLLGEEQGQLDGLLKKSESLSTKFFEARKRMQDCEEEMQKCKDSLNALQLEASKQQELGKMKEEELGRLRKGVFDDFAPKKAELNEAKSAAKAAIGPIDRLLSELFSEEKELNTRLPAWEGAFLDLKEKIAAAEGRLRAASDSSSRGIEAVMALRERNKGIYGTLGELVSYPPQYSVPVSVALGNRLHYVVVDSSKTAGAVIDHLKAHDLGRVSFIPLDKIQAPPAESEFAKKPGSLGMVLDLLEFDSAYKKAVAFACGNTVLFDKFRDAEKWAGKSVRMVTREGELFEPSGLITGGKGREKVNAYAEQSKLSGYNGKLAEAKAEKDAVVQRLYAIREQMSSERKRKADAELQLKKVELELEHIASAERGVRAQQKDLHSAIAAIEAEIGACREASDKYDDERSGWVRKLSDLNVAYLDAKQFVDVEKERHFGNMVKEKEHKVSELKLSLAKLENEHRSLQSQKGLYARQYAGVEKEMASIKAEEGQAEKMIGEAEASISSKRKELREKSEEQKGLSKELKLWIEQREELEAVVTQKGNQKGKLQFELDKITSGMNDSELKRVAVETKLTEMKAKFEEFREVQVIQNKTEKDKADLLLRKKGAEDEFKALGSVNLRAVEQYQQKADELERQKVRVVQLENEKNAVLALIAEIETKKKATFMEAYDAVNAAFRKLFKVIFRGDGTLFLENMDNPFEGGLTIQAQLENKEIKYLELMSGGEKSLIALLFLFAIQSRNPSSIYILDEADAALDQENSRKLAMLLKQLASHTQFLVVSHNETLYKYADCLVGVAMGQGGSKLVEVKLNPL